MAALLWSNSSYLGVVVDLVTGRARTREADLERLGRSIIMERYNANPAPVKVTIRTQPEAPRHRVCQRELAAAFRLARAAHVPRLATSGPSPLGCPDTLPCPWPARSARPWRSLPRRSARGARPGRSQLPGRLPGRCTEVGPIALVLLELDELVDAVDTVSDLVRRPLLEAGS